MNSYQIVIVAVLAFAFAWREARRNNALGVAGFYAILMTAIMPLSSYRFSPDLVNVVVFASLAAAGILLGRIYVVARQQQRR